MYTGLRFKGLVNKLYIDDVSRALNDEEWDGSSHDVLREFSCMDRSYMIPFGSISYMPDCWEVEDTIEDTYVGTDGFELFFDENTGLFCFQCSLKNYSDTIGSFIYDVVPVICDRVFHCEKLYEEWEKSELYVLENGEIERLPYGIAYSDVDRYSGDDVNSDARGVSLLLSTLGEEEVVDIPYKKFDHTAERRYR